MASQFDRNVNSIEASEPSLFDRIFRDSEGNIVIAQKPNLPSIIGGAAILLQLILPTGNLQTTVELIAFGIWFTWAWQELFQGVNYFRRSLGLIVLVSLIAFGLSRYGG
jgi:hypothetical protein